MLFYLFRVMILNVANSTPEATSIIIVCVTGMSLKALAGVPSKSYDIYLALWQGNIYHVPFERK